MCNRTWSRSARMPAGGRWQPWVWHHTGVVLPGWQRAIAEEGASSRRSPAIAGVEGDGDLDLVTAGTVFLSGLLWVFEVYGSSFNPAASVADWPKIRRDMVNTGRYPAPDPAVRVWRCSMRRAAA